MHVLYTQHPARFVLLALKISNQIVSVEYSAGVNSTCRSRHLGCNHRADSLCPPPCPGQSSGAGPQMRGGPHTDWEPGHREKEEKLNTLTACSTANIYQHIRTLDYRTFHSAARKRRLNNKTF